MIKLFGVYAVPLAIAYEAVKIMINQDKQNNPPFLIYQSKKESREKMRYLFRVYSLTLLVGAFCLLPILPNASIADTWDASTVKTDPKAFKEIKFGRKDLIRNDLVVSVLQIQNQNIEKYFKVQQDVKNPYEKIIQLLEAENKQLYNDLVRCQNASNVKNKK